MLPKKNRATKKEVEKAFKKGFYVASSVLSLKFFIEKSNQSPKISFVISKKIAKLATRRNYLRRLGYYFVSPYKTKLPKGFVGVFNFIKNEENTEKIGQEVKFLLDKIH